MGAKKTKRNMSCCRIRLRSLRITWTNDSLTSKMSRRQSTLESYQKTRQKLKAMEERQEALQKEFRDAVVDVKQEVSDDISEARKAHEQESNAGRLERKKLLTEVKKLRKQQQEMQEDNKLVADNEQALLRKLNKLRKKKGKGPLMEGGNAGPLTLSIVHSNGPQYSCSSCQSSRCRVACNRCNNCKTNRCRNVCRCGRTYRKHLNHLKRQMLRLKRTWGRRNRIQQKQLIRVLRDKLKRFRTKFHKALLSVPKKEKRTELDVDRSSETAKAHRG
eukprot:TRINITY_DN735_c0_g1_i2.p1 TRINITY_DN735_c0_g1~~TRINITY_DN735_c0_g1_i2.p1  ORF type:complete len:275 (+),score=42.55 TRINITY_DN735_c0_g1_i2:162-986(+)